MTEPDQERYTDARAFAREVNLPLLGEVELPSLPPGAGLPEILNSPVPEEVAPIVGSLAQTRQSLTLRSLLLAGYAHDPELFALGLAIARDWSRRGLKVAVLDLNFWSPAVVRPAGEPAEGLVDMLEFGCSFRYLAWEAVADRLWIVTPGSYLPDPERIVEHPDWDRVSRVLAGAVDVALFVAPLLERSGYLGRLSKRMDGVIVGGAVERVSRARLRDSFLELWASDAPMIGCVGIRAAAPRPAAAPATAAPVPPQAVPVPVPSPVPSAAPLEAVAPPERVPAVRPPAARPAEPPPPSSRRAPAEDVETDRALVRTLTREALEGASPPAPRRPGRLAGWLLVAAVVLIAGGGGAVLALLHPFGPKGAAFREAPPTGTDQVLPAGLGGPAGSGVPAPGAADSAGAHLSGGSPGTGAESLPFRVHVASFRSEVTVHEIADQLSAQGLEAWYEPAPDMPGWYRVFVGRFATYEEAAAEAESLLRRGLVSRAQAFPERQR